MCWMLGLDGWTGLVRLGWCVTYVDPKTARFSQQTEFGWGTYSRVKYKIVDGRLEEFSRAITLHERDFVFEPE